MARELSDDRQQTAVRAETFPLTKSATTAFRSPPEEVKDPNEP